MPLRQLKIGVVKTKCVLNTVKCTLVNFKNDLEGQINGNILKIETEQKDLGILVTTTLSWNVNASKRCQKSLSAFYSLKRNLSENCRITSKLNAYTGYVVPMVVYGASVTHYSKSNLRAIEKDQRTATKWMLNSHIPYKCRLQKIRMLPLSLYIEKHDLLLFISIVRNNYEIDINQYAENTKSSRQNERNEYQIPKTRLKKTNSDFIRCPALFNVIIRHTSKQLSDIQKSDIAEIYWKFFERYSEMDSCTWQIMCPCGNCNPNGKLRTH